MIGPRPSRLLSRRRGTDWPGNQVQHALLTDGTAFDVDASEAEPPGPARAGTANGGRSDPPRIRPESGQGEIGAIEIVADAEEWLIGKFGDGVGEAVAEIQAGRVAAFAEPSVGVDGSPPVRLAERNDGERGLLEKPRQDGPSVAAQACAENNAGFHEGGRADAGIGGGGELGDDGLVTGLSQRDRDQR